MKNRWQRYKRGFLRWGLVETPFCIISNDCWGAEVYRELGIAYNTPFVGLYLMAPCYLSLLKDIRLINGAMRFIRQSKYPCRNAFMASRPHPYPIGVLEGDIEIHFLHYNNEEDALKSWRRRAARMDFENLRIKFDADKDLATAELTREFQHLPFQHKLCISSHTIKDVDCAIPCSDWELDGARMFLKSTQYFSAARWLNGKGLGQPSILERWLWGT